MRDGEVRGLRIYSRDGTEHGLTTGGVRPCQLESCGGNRIAVRWPDGELSYPCTKSMVALGNGSRRQIVPAA